MIGNQRSEEGTNGKLSESVVSRSSRSQWSGGTFRNPRIVRVSRFFGGKDRHSKVCTVRGLRDRRIRLSVHTAIVLYDLQERLGLSQPSKVIDWLLEASKHDIDKLPPLEIPQDFGQFMLQHSLLGHVPFMRSHRPESFSSSTTSLPYNYYASDHHESSIVDEKGKWIKENHEGNDNINGHQRLLFPMGMHQNQSHNINSDLSNSSLSLSNFGVFASNVDQHSGNVNSGSCDGLVLCPSSSTPPSLLTPYLPPYNLSNPMLDGDQRVQLNRVQLVSSSTSQGFLHSLNSSRFLALKNHHQRVEAEKD